jgi:putative ABC transport system permease protein
MRFLMFLSQFWRDMKSQKLRTFMTIFGIIWGTAAIVLLLAFGVGLERQMLKSWHGFGEGIIVTWAQITSKTYQGLPKGRRLSFRPEDAFLLKQEISQIKYVCPEYNRGGFEFKYGNNTYNARIRGIYPDYSPTRNIIPQRGGRFIDRLDIEQKRRTVLLGNRLKEELFEDEPAVGKYVNINNVPFLIVGVMVPKQQNSNWGGSDRWTACMPATTFSSLFGYRYLSYIIIQGKDPRQNKIIRKKIYQVFGKKFKFDPEDEDAIGLFDLTDFDKFFTYFTIGFKIFLGIVGAFTLIVGGIGVSNIMNVVVEERTKEIGIKMALGAKKRFILSQFIFETLLITFIGGFIGFGISYSITQVLPAEQIEEYVGIPTVSLGVAISAIILLGTIGFIAAYSPARRAANLNPVEALRK